MSSGQRIKSGITPILLSCFVLAASASAQLPKKLKKAVGGIPSMDKAIQSLIKGEPALKFGLERAAIGFDPFPILLFLELVRYIFC